MARRGSKTGKYDRGCLVMIAALLSLCGCVVVVWLM